MDITGAATLLGMQRTPLTEENLGRAWRRFARATHPDAHPHDPAAGEHFTQGREAYEVLRRRMLREQEAGWATTPPIRRPGSGRVLRGADADRAVPYRFSTVASREWRA